MLACVTVNSVSTWIIEGDSSPLRVAILAVEQYEAMIETGILPEGEPIELLNGVLAVKDRSRAGESSVTIGLQHKLVVPGSEVARN